MSSWSAAVYAFYNPVPKIEYIDGCRMHTFKCSSPRCKVRIRRYLDTKNALSTLALRRHAEKCWGIEVVNAAKEAASPHEARKEVVTGILCTGSITTHFQRKEGQVTYSHCNHMSEETQIKIVKWVCESQSMRPFRIVKDRGFVNLMKTGRPGYRIPSPAMVGHDVKTVFTRAT